MHSAALAEVAGMGWGGTTALSVLSQCSASMACVCAVCGRRKRGVTQHATLHAAWMADVAGAGACRPRVRRGTHPRVHVLSTRQSRAGVALGCELRQPQPLPKPVLSEHFRPPPRHSLPPSLRPLHSLARLHPRSPSSSFKYLVACTPFAWLALWAHPEPAQPQRASPRRDSRRSARRPGCRPSRRCCRARPSASSAPSLISPSWRWSRWRGRRTQARCRAACSSAQVLECHARPICFAPFGRNFGRKPLRYTARARRCVFDVPRLRRRSQACAAGRASPACRRRGGNPAVRRGGRRGA